MSFFNKFPKTKYDFFGEGQTVQIPDIFRHVAPSLNALDNASMYAKVVINEERPDQLSYKLYGTVDHYWTFFLINDSLRGVMNNWPYSYQGLIEHIDNKYTGYALTLFRTAEDDITFNSIAGKFDVGTQIVGQTTGAIATVTGRNAHSNTLLFTYDSGVFQDTEILYIDSQLYVQPDNWNARLHKYAPHSYIDNDGDKFSNNDFTTTTDAFLVTYQDYEQILNDERKEIKVVRKDSIEKFSLQFRRLINS